jgi:hypothetical protein
MSKDGQHGQATGVIYLACCVNHSAAFVASISMDLFAPTAGSNAAFLYRHTRILGF